MKRFRFNLEDVLELRKFKEEESLLDLGQAINILNKIEDEIQQTARKKAAALRNRFNNFDDIISWDMYIARLDRDAEKLARQAAQAELVVEEKRAIYLEAEKEVKIMEELKEMQKKEYKKDEQDKVNAEIDDMNAARKKELI